jgi:hypothetical protein
VRLPGVAPGHSPWRDDILLLTYNHLEIKRAGSASANWPSARTSRPMPFQQRTNTSWCDTNPRFHGGSFGVLGHTSCKALKMQSVSNRLGTRFRQRWTVSTGGKLRPSCPSSVAILRMNPSAGARTRGLSPALPLRRMDASIRLVLSDIIQTSFSFYSQCSAFRNRFSLLFRSCMGRQKTLLPFR